MNNYDQVANDEKIQKAVDALNANGFAAEVVADLEAAKEVVLKKIPDGSEVFTGVSETLKETGLDIALNSAPYSSVRDKLMALRGQEGKELEMRRLGSASDYVVSSVHAITEDGKLLVASASGSQIPNEVYGATQVIFVVGAQKIVTDLDDGIKRIEEYSVPLEDKRAMVAYGSHTAFRKLFVYNSERPDRVSVVIIKQKVGF